MSYWHTFPICALERHVGYCMLGPSGPLTKEPFEIDGLFFHASCGGGGEVIFTCVGKEGHLSLIAEGFVPADEKANPFFQAFDKMLVDTFKDNPTRVVTPKGFLGFILQFLGKYI